MSHKTQTRWLNEYLDGEIGLADKAELERVMAANPELREEYRELRQIGLLMGNMPEVDVHPYRFRQKLQDALERRHNPFFTPQRTFAVSMLISMVVIGLTFGLYFYQQTFTVRHDIPVSAAPSQDIHAAVSDLALATEVTAEQFFDRLALETQLGYADPALLLSVTRQTSIYEGAICADSQGLVSTSFPAPLPRSVRLRVSPDQVRDLAEVASGLSGRPAALLSGTNPLTVDGLPQQFPGRQQITLVLKFN